MRERLETAFYTAEKVGVTRLLDPEGKKIDFSHILATLPLQNWYIERENWIITRMVHFMVVFTPSLFHVEFHFPFSDVDTHEIDEKSIITYVSSLFDAFPDPPAVHPLYDNVIIFFRIFLEGSYRYSSTQFNIF